MVGTRLTRLELNPALELVELAQVLVLEARGSASVAEALADALRAACQEVGVVALVRHGEAPGQDGQALGLEQVEVQERAARLVAPRVEVRVGGGVRGSCRVRGKG